METLKAIKHPISKQAQILVEICSFVATGNVLRVQRLLHFCGEHLEAVKEKEEAQKEKDKDKGEKKEERKEDEQKLDDTFQSFAVLGIAMIAMGEEIGAEMSMRQFNHLVGFLPDVTLEAVIIFDIRCTMVIQLYANRSLLLLVLSVLLTHNFPSSILCPSTAMTLTYKLH